MKGRNQTVGQAGEQAAADYLKQRGYTILARNVRNTQGELDIIAQKEGCLVFVEVKTRTTGAYGPAAAAVGKAKQKHISAASALYMQQNGLCDACVRYDVMTVDVSQQMQVQHIKHAFEYQANNW